MTLKRKVCAPEPCLWTIDGSGPTLGLRCWRCGRSAPWVTPPRSGIQWVQVIAWAVTVALALAALALAAGCGLEVNPEFEVPAPNGGVEQTQVVLRALGHQDAKPEVHWYGPKAEFCRGICPDGTDRAGQLFAGFENPMQSGQCVTGVTQGMLTIVMVPPDNLPLWTSQLAHELIHNSAVTEIHDHPVGWYGPDPHSCSLGGQSPLGGAIRNQQAFALD